MEGKEISIDADSEEDYELKAKWVEEFYRFNKTIEDYQCLALGAPIPMCEAEQVKRKESMENFFIQAFQPDHFDNEQPDNLREYHEVYERADVEKYIQSFFRSSDGISANKAIHAIVVLFGHGSEEGFCVRPTDRVPLDDVINMVGKELKKARLQSPVDLPVWVELILPHCFGHLYSEDVRSQYDGFKVTKFTTPEHPLTFSKRNKKKGWYNRPLNDYARNDLRPEVKGMEEAMVPDRQ